jgi:single-stranded-DNA-specific exonuclease
MKTKLVNPIIKGNYLQELLKMRGVGNIEGFLNPTPQYLQTPFDLDNMREGIDLVNKIINDKGRILIIVDCDVDGFTSSAIFYQYFHEVAPELEIDWMIHEGKAHGLQEHIKTLLDGDKQYALIVCPDSSTNDGEMHDELGGIGTPVLVLDHHDLEPESHLSDNAIIINNQMSSNYLNKDLTGAGVTFQFCRGYDIANGLAYADKYIDLAALGICADMGSILSMENKYIIDTGFNNNNITNYFFQKFCEKQSYSMGCVVNYNAVAFYIVPSINAMIRVGTESEKERMFLAFIDGHRLVESHKRGAHGVSEEVAVESIRECVNARTHQNTFIDNAVEQLENKIAKLDLLSNKVLFVCLDTEDFPAEINGVIAMKLAAKYKKPTILGRLNDTGEIKGSIRGVNNSALADFKGFLNDSNFFDYVQGHPNAAGMCIKSSKLSAFHEYANEKLANIDFGEGVYSANFERIAADNDISDLIEDLDSHPEIWGQGNPEPMIHITDINVDKSDIKIMGKNMDTVRITKFGICYMKFFAKDFIAAIKDLDNFKMEVVGTANLNTWGGNVTPQIFITNYDIKTSNLGW